MTQSRRELKLKYVVIHETRDKFEINNLFLSDKVGHWTKDIDEARLFDRASDGAIALVVMKGLNEIPAIVDIDRINIRVCTYADRNLGSVI